MTSKHKRMTEDDIHFSMDLISKELQNNNHHGVMELFKLVVQQNTRLKSSFKQISNEIRNIKGASDELSHKLNKLHQKQSICTNHHHESSLLQQIMDINHEISNRSGHLMTYTQQQQSVHKNGGQSTADGTRTHSQSYSYYGVQSHCRDSIDNGFDTEHTIHSINSSTATATHNGMNDHDLSIIMHNIDCEESSVKTESITFVTDEHHATSHSISTSNFSDDTMHHLSHLNGSNFNRKSEERQKRRKHSKTKRKTRSSRARNNNEHSKSNSVLSQHGSPEEIVSKLESDGRILALIEKGETKDVPKRKLIKFLQKKGVDLDKISDAYAEYYKQHNLYEIVFERGDDHKSSSSSSHLGFGMTADEKGDNAMITWIADHELMRKGMKTGSIMYEINGKRVRHKAHNQIMKILAEHRRKHASFCIIFEYNEARMQEIHAALKKKSKKRNNNNKKKKLTLHEHSTITSITQSQNEDICDVVSRVDMNWERIGQILLDHRFLDTARLINQALDHLETFCNDEDVDENAWRDEICRAWSVTDDRGILLWQILYGNLKYSADERRWFYDLMLRFYFKLNDMKTANIVFLCTKILRDMKQPIDLVQMKEILAVNKVDGFSFNAEIKTAKGFADLFCTMQNVSSSVWHKLYYGLTQWNPDDAIRNKHADHQKKYKNKVIDDGNHVRGASAAAEITIFPDITRVSIRDGIDYSNSAEKKEWVAYRHNIKNVFIAFAGYHASQMTHGEFERLLSIFDIGQFCSMHLMQQDVITMDEFIKWLCSEYINDAARDIRKHIEKLPQWTLFVNALSFLDQLEEDAQGILQYKHFQRFAINLSLNDIESKILFDKICANTSASYGPGCIHMNHVFEWLKKHCMQRLIKATKTTKKEIKKTTL
eukprot:88787_1